MRIISCFLLLISGFLLHVGCGSPATEPAPKAPEANRVPAAYAGKCSKCHGDDGKLMLAGAKDLSKSTMTKEEILHIIKSGKGGMPPYGSLLTEPEMAEIAEFVLQLRK